MVFCNAAFMLMTLGRDLHASYLSTPSASQANQKRRRQGHDGQDTFQVSFPESPRRLPACISLRSWFPRTGVLGHSQSSLRDWFQWEMWTQD
jgi:hypothetical protein